MPALCSKGRDTSLGLLDPDSERTIVPVDLRQIADWTLLPGASIEIRQQGRPVSTGHVDAVTADGKVLWLQSPAQNRRLFEKTEFYEAWATVDRTGFTERPQDGPR